MYPVLLSLWFQHFRIQTQIGLIFCLISVKTPREQVADAQALLGITRSLVASVKNHANGGLTPSVFVTHILKVFGRQGGTSTGTEDRRRIPIAWKDIGIAVSNVFGRGFGCSTM